MLSVRNCPGGGGRKNCKKGIAKAEKLCYNAQCVRSKGGRRFPIGMSPSGKAPDFDSGIRRFESGHPSQIYDPLAQSAEQLPFKQWVRSSNLRRVTKNPECASVRDFYFFLFHYSLFMNLRIRDFWKVRRNSE